VPPTQIDNADAIADADLALLRSVNGTVDRPEVVRDLLQRRKANVNACDEWGQTVLKWAVWWGLAGSVRVLLDHGADVNAASTDGGAPLHMAVYQGQLVWLVIVLLFCIRKKQPYYLRLSTTYINE
jgi:ankyrin repeat protein